MFVTVSWSNSWSFLKAWHLSCCACVHKWWIPQPLHFAHNLVFSYGTFVILSHTLWCELSCSDVTMSTGWLMNAKEFDVSCSCAYGAKNCALLTMLHWLRAWCKKHSSLPSWCKSMVGYRSIPCWYEHLRSVLREFVVSTTSHVVCIMGLSMITVNGRTRSPLP